MKTKPSPSPLVQLQIIFSI